MAAGRSITTVILAGGKGSRMGGNKALRDLRGLPLIEWVIGAIMPQGNEILISANDNQAALAEFGYPVIQDLLPGYAGPLAGLQAAMHYASGEWVASVPCDTPFLPDDLIERLFEAAGAAEAAVAVVNGRRQPAIALYRRNVLHKLSAYLDSGERKASAWLDLLEVREAKFDDADAFININSLEELEAAGRGRG
jgi:molybdopterin-guanine dinucleotide biosynthesis protein A